jgi:dolichol-phosphate mannosyltransferase
MPQTDLLTILIPAHNEADSLPRTLRSLSRVLTGEGISFEILVVNDHSSDTTSDVLVSLHKEIPELRWVANEKPNGFGYALQTGLENYLGDAVCIVMADASDDPADVVKYYRALEGGSDCVFGSRFIPGSRVVDYPAHKLLINRLANQFIETLFGLRYNDVTNAFKCYRRHVIDGIMPIFSCHFNLTVEMPLKAIVRGYTYAVVPINWYNRTEGFSKLKIKEMGSRYLFIVLYVLLEKLLSRGDYQRKDIGANGVDQPALVLQSERNRKAA